MSQDVDRILRHIKQRPIRQDSLTAQLDDLCVIAVKLGLYDAEDWIKSNLRRV